LIFIAFTICVLILVLYGSFNLFRAVSGTSIEKGRFMRGVVQIALLGSFTLLTQCIFFTLYTKSGNFSWKWAWILIPMEIIPTTKILAIISQQKPLASSKDSSKWTGQSGSAMGMQAAPPGYGSAGSKGSASSKN